MFSRSILGVSRDLRLYMFSQLTCKLFLYNDIVVCLTVVFYAFEALPVARLMPEDGDTKCTDVGRCEGTFVKLASLVCYMMTL